jgi:Fe-S-cluster-containing dehydrogenase component
MKKWRLIIDVEKCENCSNCFLSCRDEHVDNEWPGYASAQAGQGPGWIEVLRKERGQYPLIDVAYLPLTCMQCRDAPCMQAALGGAVRRRPDGIVIIDPERSRGQRQIVSACPYNAVRWNEATGTPQKCTLCAHLLDEGWEQTRCVQSCPTGALSLRKSEDGEMEEAAGSDGLAVYRPELGTKPSVYYRNLHRFTRCFIAGSVAVQTEGKEECAEGAEIVLTNARGETTGREAADAFGDFKLDNLEEHSGPYRLTISYKGYKGKTLEVSVTESVSLGTILLEKDRS